MAVRARHMSCHLDRKSTRLNSSHGYISYAVFCLKKKKNMRTSSVEINKETEPLARAHCHTHWISGRSLIVRSGLPGRLYFFFNDTATTEIYTLSLHDALPI